MTAALTIAATLLGAAAGWLHFRSLRAVSERLMRGELRAAGFQIARFAALGIFLFLCAKGGAWPLIGAGAGIMLGRHAALRET